jgi:hypothetical protein
MTATATTPMEKEIVDLQHEFWEATKNADRDELSRLTDDQFTFVMGEGVHNFSRNDFVTMMTDGDFKLKSYTLSEPTVRELSPGFALIGYKARESFEREGKAQEVESYSSAIWKKSGKTWQCAVATESRIEP